MCRALFVLLLVVVALGVAVLAAPAAEEDHAECKAKLANYTAMCKTELKLADADVDALLKTLTLPFPDKTKCLINCIAEKFMLIKDGKLIDSAVLAIINDPKKPAARRDTEIQIYNKCKTQVGKDNCDTAGLVLACILSTGTKA